jgi:hypothetical protein
MHEALVAANGGRPINPRDPRFARFFGAGAGQVSGLGGRKSRKLFAMAQAQASEADAQNKAASLIRDAEAAVLRARGALTEFMTASQAAQAAVRRANDPSLFSLTSQLNDARYEAEAAVQEAEGALTDAKGRATSAKSSGGTAGAIEAIAAAAMTAKDAAGRALRSANGAMAIVGQVQVTAQEALRAAQQAVTTTQQASQAEADRLRYDAEQRRAERDYTAAQEQARYDREQRAIQAERDYQAQQIASRESREAAIQAQAAAASQAEIQFQQQLVQMEQERAQQQFQAAQEREARNEERRAAREQQDQMLQQLLVLQELGINPLTGQGAGAQMPGMPPGVPQGFAPPGAYMAQGFGPQLPGVASAMQQGFAPAGYMPQAQVYMPQQPAEWQQGYGVSPAGQAPAGSGFEMVSFSPKSELFGFGGFGAVDNPVGNTALRGSLVEAGYSVYGPSVDAQRRPFYTFESPDGRTWTAWGTQVIGPTATPQKDPSTGRVVYAPPPGGVAPEEPTNWGSIGEALRNVIGTGVQTYRDVGVAREERRMLATQRRNPGFMPGGAPPEASIGAGLPGWVAPVGIAAVGLGILAAVLGGKKKNGKK